MAILSDYEEESMPPTASTSHAALPFSATLNPSEPLRFLDDVFSFVARHTDFLSDEKDVLALLRAVRDREHSKKHQPDIPEASSHTPFKVAVKPEEDFVAGPRGFFYFFFLFQ
uniref:Uncharacterized protein n=1 Tax=Kalanchoe fedtschenkoi TaxID=63787 RepID=A0A7N0TQS7_KALFE